MVTVYHNLEPDLLALLAADRGMLEMYSPEPETLELAAVVRDTDDLMEAFDHVIHRDGENWTADPRVMFFGNPRGRRSSHEGDVFVAGDGTAHLVLPLSFRELPGLRLPFLP